MPAFDTLALFVGVVALFAVAPGPAVFYVVARSLSQGRRSGLVSAMAVACGNLVHVAVAGVSALLASSAIAFAVIKYTGAAYLIYLGVRAILGRDGSAVPAEGAGQGVPALSPFLIPPPHLRKAHFPPQPAKDFPPHHIKALPQRMIQCPVNGA